MPLVCFAPGCKSGYASERKHGIRHHYFKLPKDEELRKMWKNKIPRIDREMAAHDVLCDIHFDSKDVITHDTFTINGEIVKVARERYKLVIGAQPIHFPNLTNKPGRKKKASNYNPNSNNNILESKPIVIRSTRNSRKYSGIQKIKETKTDKNKNNICVMKKMDIETEEILQPSAIIDHTDESIESNEIQSLKRRNASLQILLRKKRREHLKLISQLKQQNGELAKIKSQLRPFKCMSTTTNNLVEIFTEKNTRKKKIRYSKDFILDCVLLRMKSAKGYYHCLSHELLPLPSEKIYHQLLSNLRHKTKKKNNFIEMLKAKLKHKPENECLGVLVVKEIEIQNRPMEFDGSVNSGDGRANEVVDKALVFSFRTLMEELKEKIACYSMRSRISGKNLAKLILEVIISVENTGAKIIAFVCDGNEMSRSAIICMGFNGRRGSFKSSVPHPCDTVNRRIYCLFDVPQVIMCIHEQFRKKKQCQFLNWKLDFQFYEELLKEELTQPAGLRMVPQLTAHHTTSSEIQKNNSTLSIQLFSQSTACGLRIYREMQKENFINSEESEKFTSYISQLYDILNSHGPTDGLQENNDDHKFLMDVDTVLASPEISTNTVMTAGTLECLRLTVHSTLQICNFLWRCGFSYVSTEKLNQYCNEI